MEKFAKTTKVRVILACVATVSLLYYVTPLRLCLAQELFTRFYYVPMVVEDEGAGKIGRAHV